MIKETNAPEETFAFGKMLGEQAKPGEVICLNGDLGVGKTVFTKGFAEGLGITEPVNSPTFTIVQQYDSGRMPLYHFDVYRIGDISEMDEVGYEDCFYGEGVTLIEWSNMIEEILPENPLLDSFELTLTSASSDKELLDSFIAAAGRIEGVDRVSYPALMAERLHATVNKIRLVLLLFGGALLVISLILLGNTIRLAIFSKRYLINTMKLVGATKWFIMRPFLGSSLTQGILAGTAASALFGLAVYGLNEAVPELMTIAEAGKIAIILGSMIAGGIIISGLFTFAALNKFINMKSNKIYLY